MVAVVCAVVEVVAAGLGLAVVGHTVLLAYPVGDPTDPVVATIDVEAVPVVAEEANWEFVSGLAPAQVASEDPAAGSEVAWVSADLGLGEGRSEDHRGWRERHWSHVFEGAPVVAAHSGT